MAIKFQYNKTSQQAIVKQLSIRERALPTLKNKEAALRVEVAKAREEVDKYDKLIQDVMLQHSKMIRMWQEFDNSLVVIDDVDLNTKKIAGVKTPILEKIHFRPIEFSVFNNPSWFLDAIEVVKEIATLEMAKETFVLKSDLLLHARRKTTQKVNLYEKVQIPGFQEAILKIKRYLEDEENLSKAAQKIVKARISQAEEVEA